MVTEARHDNISTGLGKGIGKLFFGRRNGTSLLEEVVCRHLGLDNRRILVSLDVVHRHERKVNRTLCAGLFLEYGYLVPAILFARLAA
jgi:hypothetical protein